ncbi:hypothetical protein DXG01_016705 [Tephrocybe rancida]|nr:hypothetical protein DXG01_016705 [Tephrocybe rancida]
MSQKRQRDPDYDKEMPLGPKRRRASRGGHDPTVPLEASSKKLINKTNAKNKYKVNDKDLEELHFQAGVVPAPRSVGFKGPVSRHLYNEREVQVIAWRKHGGREGFKAHIDDLKARNTRRKNRLAENSDRDRSSEEPIAFTQQRRSVAREVTVSGPSRQSREPTLPVVVRRPALERHATVLESDVIDLTIDDSTWGGRPSLNEVEPPSTSQLVGSVKNETKPKPGGSKLIKKFDEELKLNNFQTDRMVKRAETPIEAEDIKSMVEDFIGANWLLKAAKTAVERLTVQVSTEDAQTALQAASGQLRYPERPAAPPESNAVLEYLRLIINDPPRRADVNSGCCLHDGRWTWSREYLEELFGALNSVLVRLGAEVWKDVRWEVYDAVNPWAVLNADKTKRELILGLMAQQSGSADALSRIDTLIKKIYRMDPDRFSDLKFKTIRTPRRGNWQVSYEFVERDVERTAWSHHGGSEAFEAYLTFLRTLRQVFPDWALDKCDEALEGQEFSESQFEMSQARKALLPYPPRPESLLPASSSVKALRKVLNLAAAYREWDDGPPRIVSDEDEDGGRSAEWSEAYVSEIYEALGVVTDRHGLGDDGWKTVRWEVYDTCVFSLGGIWSRACLTNR